MVHLPEPCEERDARWNPPPEHQGVLAPLDLQGAPLVLADRLEPGPCLVQRAPDQAGVAVDMRELRIRVSGELEQAVECAAPEDLDLGARVAQQPHEGIRIGAGRGRGHADPSALAGVEEKGDREVRPGPRQEVQVHRGRCLVESVDRFVERTGLFGRCRRLRDFLEALDLRLQLPDPGLNGSVRLAVSALQPSDFRALLGDPVETPPCLPRPVEVPTAGLPKGCIEPSDEPRRETLLLRRFPEVRCDRLDVAGEDPHLAPVVDLALAEEAIDPLTISIQGAVEDTRDSLHFLAGPPDRFEELRGLRLEGLRGRLVAGRHESDAMEPRTYLGSFVRLSKPPCTAISYISGRPSRFRGSRPGHRSHPPPGG